VLKSEHVTFDELSERLRSYEQRYGYSTIEFYRRYRDGELGDDDDLMMWAGLYHLYLTSLPVRQFMQSELAAARPSTITSPRWNAPWSRIPWSAVWKIPSPAWPRMIITYPHHKHIGPEDRLAPADQPTLSQILAEIAGQLEQR